jgi:hypothetical protein
MPVDYAAFAAVLRDLGVTGSVFDADGTPADVGQ